MKNFSKVFVAVIAVAVVAPSIVAAYGGGGGYWRSKNPIVAPSIFTEEPVAPVVEEPEVVVPQVGQVLGVATFRFNINLSQGMRHSDVTELQNRLTEEGVYNGPVTGYFGPLTRAAVVRYQLAHNITPAVGYVGPLTRSALNAGANNAAAAGSALTAGQRSAMQGQIDQLLDLVRGLMARLAAL